MIPKFLHNRHRYPELAIFPKMEYSFDNDLRIQEVPKQLLEMFNIYSHLPQVVIIILGLKTLDTVQRHNFELVVKTCSQMSMLCGRKYPRNQR